MQPKPVRVPDLREQKRHGEKIAVLTAYDATTARLLDRAGVDVLLGRGYGRDGHPRL